MGIVVNLQERREIAVIDARRERACDAIEALWETVTYEHWDTCDVADAIVMVVEACDLHNGGNLEGLILGIPNDYSELIEGLHFPDECEQEEV
ncbi:hypothetical protein LWE61_05575 [Sphingobium sufflavum]|uniref:hypothetical protein n=1 Tax=Sphingobium sufflavum TaxID=1129547 RepID=UPI001F1DC07A|nr:hypothetical protein [Sphingobium sufflavum]MCE7796030.1 hypothetical protein [Sphingobium sufflavum]